MKMTEKEQEIFRKKKNEVVEWARNNCSNDLYYGTPYSYWVNAKLEGICSDEEFDTAKIWYGNLWHYRGD